MTHSRQSFRIAITSALLFATFALPALADIDGFGSFSDFQINLGDTQAFPLVDPTTGTVRLTNSSFQSRSIFHKTRQDITAFTASFRYQPVGDMTSPFGATFVIQNSSAESRSVARYSASGVTTKFGYTDAFGAFNNSVATSLEFGSLGAGSSSTGVYTDGQVGGASASTFPLDLFSSNPIDVAVTYDGNLLETRFVDAVTGDMDSFTTLIDLESFVHDSFAYVGFTASGGSNAGLEQFISDFQFKTIPAPATLPVLAMTGLGTMRRRRAC